MGSAEKIYYVMGVSGSGKTTLGQQLARHLGIPFFDGDDFHPPENIQKMAGGAPLDDEDRKGWLLRLNALAGKHKGWGRYCLFRPEGNVPEITGVGVGGQSPVDLSPWKL